MDKQLAILVRLADDKGVWTKFLNMPTCNLSSADDLFQVVDATLRYGRRKIILM